MVENKIKNVASFLNKIKTVKEKWDKETQDKTALPWFRGQSYLMILKKN